MASRPTSRRTPRRIANLLLAGLAPLALAACGQGTPSKAEVLACVNHVKDADAASEGLEQDAAVEGLTKEERHAYTAGQQWADQNLPEVHALQAKTRKALDNKEAEAAGAFIADAEAILKEYDALVERKCSE